MSEEPGKYSRRPDGRVISGDADHEVVAVCWRGSSLALATAMRVPHPRLVQALRRLDPGAPGRRLTVEVNSEAGARALRRAILCELDRVW